MKKLGPEFEELLLIIDRTPIRRIVADEDDWGECTACGRTEVPVVGLEFNPDGDRIDICQTCSLLVMPIPMFESAWKCKKSAFSSEMVFDVEAFLVEKRREKIAAPPEPVFDAPDFFTGTATDFMTKLKTRFPKFALALSGFLAGDVRLFDGKQHPLLDSIAKQVVDNYRMPSEKQEAAFRAIYEKLVADKAAGRPLKLETPDEKIKRAAVSRRLVAIARRNIHRWPGEKTREVIRSMAAQFDARGTLSEKQINYLRFIVEQLPASELAKED